MPIMLYGLVLQLITRQCTDNWLGLLRYQHSFLLALALHADDYSRSGLRRPKSSVDDRPALRLCLCRHGSQLLVGGSFQCTWHTLGSLRDHRSSGFPCFGSPAS